MFTYITVSAEDSRPVYQQISAQVIHAVEVGILPEESRLPSIKALAVELRVNPNTIAHAYKELEGRGFLYTKRGEGSFVRRSKDEKHRRVAQRNVEQLAWQIVQAAETAGLDLNHVQNLVVKKWNRRRDNG